MSQVTADQSEELRLRQQAKQLKALAKETQFSGTEVQALAVIYHKFLSENGAKRSQMERTQLRAIFHSVFEITDDFLIDRSFAYLDKSGSAYVSLESWIKTLSLFLRGSLEEKMKYCFSVYDVNSDGMLKRNEVIVLLGKCFVGEHDEDIELAVKDLADIIVRKMDLDADGMISFQDYRSSVLDQEELLECFGRCLPERRCAFSFTQTFTAENLRF